MPKIALALILSCITAFAEPVLAEPVVEIPFRFTEGFICIEARLAQSARPLNLMLDSGAGASVLSLRTARRLKLKIARTENVRGVGSEAAAYHFDPVQMTAGTVVLPETGLAVDLSMADELCSRPIDGLIGVGFFRDRVVQIDYKHHCLRLSGPVSDGEVGERLPIKMVNGIMCVPVGVNESQPRWTRFDTGCNDALHWVVPQPQERPARMGVSLGFVTNPNDTTLTSVLLGSRSLDKVKTALHGRELFSGEAGLLGNGLLSRFTVTVDWPRGEVRLCDSPR
jgi:hypothetical protein